jgi:hypothetical protein
VIVEAIKLVHFVLFIDLGSGWINTAWHPEKNGQKPDHAACTLPAALPVVRLKIHSEILRIGTVNRRSLISEAVVHEHFLSKHLLKTVWNRFFWKGIYDFQQPMCAGYEYLQNNPVWSMLHPPTRHRKAWEVAVAIHRTLFDAHNSAPVAELEFAVRGTDITADHATPSPPSAGNCGDPPGASTTRSFYRTHNILLFHGGAPAIS